MPQMNQRMLGNNLRRAVRLATCVVVGCSLFITTTADAAEGDASGDGDADMVELISGLRLRGRLGESVLKVDSSLGQFDLPSDELHALVCLEPLRMTHALSTRSGDVLVGKLLAETIRFTPGDGAAVELKLSQISQLTRRADAMSSMERAAALPVIHAVGGSQIAVAAGGSFEFVTRSGVLSFEYDQVYEIIFDAPSQAAHRILLTDGSTLSGFVAGDVLVVQPKHLADSKRVIPVAAVRAMEFPPSASLATEGPRLNLLGGDVLRGALQGFLTLQSELGPLPIAAEEIQSIEPVAKSPGELALSLIDGRTITGTPSESVVVCRLGCGVSVSVPIEMMSGYVKSIPGFLQLSASPERPRGLTALLGGDGIFTITQQHGTRCWRLLHHHYLYFAVDEALRPWPGGEIEIEIEYFDGGPGQFTLDYDSNESPYKRHETVIQRANSGGWETARYPISDARFSGAQNLGADFRIHHSGDEPLIISAARLRQER
jgi:hypothetical protein